LARISLWTSKISMFVSPVADEMLSLEARRARSGLTRA
jgi:hypothetical protein